MSPSPNPQDSPFTATSDFDGSTFASIFATKSDNMPDPPIPTPSVDAARSSFMASILSGTNTNTGPNAQSTTLATSPSSSTAIAASTSTGSSATSSTDASSGATSSASSLTGAATSSNAASSSAHASGTSAASNGSTSNELQAQAAGPMSSPGMQAAVAVPVVVVVIAAIALIFFIMRRRRKRRGAPAEIEEKAQAAGRRKPFSRHLRIFSFDTELLMGGRYSSTNSIRSRELGSTRSNTANSTRTDPSLHSVEEVAPSYNHAISAAQPPNIGQVMAGGAAVGGVARSASQTTAPPPYRTPTPNARPTSTLRPPQNPFSDTPPVSPIDASPFNDPPGLSPAPSRASSFRDDASTIGGASDAGSIRQATLARNASVMTGGRVIDNVGRNSQ